MTDFSKYINSVLEKKMNFGRICLCKKWVWKYLRSLL